MNKPVDRFMQSSYTERLAQLQRHYLGAYKARLREGRLKGPRELVKGSEAERVYLSGRW